VDCVVTPANTPGSASGGGRSPDELAELAISGGSHSGGTAKFRFDAEYEAGVPGGELTFSSSDGKKVESTAIDSFSATAHRSVYTGRATVNGVRGVKFSVVAEDLDGVGGTDSFRIVLADGYAAGGKLMKGEIRIRSGALVGLG
jgi:hypothetical protein